MGVKEFARRRQQWLRIQREFMEAVLVAKRRPADYDTHPEDFEEEFISDEPVVIDGHMIINVDEVPFRIDWTTRQLVVEGSRYNLNQTALRFLTKYRMGTLVIFMTPFEPLLIVLIFIKAGGPVVQADLRDFEGSTTSNVICTGNKSGSMDGPIWDLSLRTLAGITKERRGADDLDGSWKYAMCLYADCYGTHMNAAKAHNLYETTGIALCPLLKNCSHLQQPVDQHYGQFFKSCFKRALLRLMIDFQKGRNMGREMEIDAKKFRELCYRAVQDICDQVYI